MHKELTIVEARNRLTQLPEELSGGGEHAITITRRGRPVMAVMSNDLFESIMETLEIMSDPELMVQLRASIREADNGEIIPWDEINGIQ